MGKITRAESKAHDEALALLSLTRPLTDDEIETVYRQYNPMAEHNVGKGAIFFTPYDLAEEFAMEAETDGTVIDLCAGIGVLSRHMVMRNRHWKPHKRLVCVEVSDTFVEIGKKLVPEAEWYCADVFDLDFLTSIGNFDIAISNPPYGNIPGKGDWLKVKGPAHWQVIELSLRLCYNGGVFIIPEIELDYSTRLSRYRERPNRVKYLDKHFPGVYVMPGNFDASPYRDQWMGATPDVQIASVDVSDITWNAPYGFADVRPGYLIEVPRVAVQKKELAPVKPKEKPNGVQLSFDGG